MPSAKPVALITGGANGIGCAVARHLLTAGWRIGVVDLPGSGLRRSFSARNRNVVLVEGYVREQETAARAIAALVERFGHLDGLVSNARIMIRKKIAKCSTRATADQKDDSGGKTAAATKGAEHAMPQID